MSQVKFTEKLFSRNIEDLQEALSNGADPNYAYPDNGCTPLYYFSLGGLTPHVKLLLENKAEVNKRTNNQTTALHVAKNIATAKTLLEAGADINVKGYFNQTPEEYIGYPREPEVNNFLKEWRQTLELPDASAVPSIIPTTSSSLGPKDQDGSATISDKTDLAPTIPPKTDSLQPVSSAAGFFNDAAGRKSQQTAFLAGTHTRAGQNSSVGNFFAKNDPPAKAAADFGLIFKFAQGNQPKDSQADTTPETTSSIILS